MKLKRINGSLLILILVALGTTCTKSLESEFRFRDEEHVINNSKLMQMYSDSLMIFCEGNYENTLISLKINDRILEDTLTTHEDIGLANVYNAGYRNDINSIEVSLDDSDYLTIPLDKDFKFIVINKIDEKIVVEYLTKYPMYE